MFTLILIVLSLFVSLNGEKLDIESGFKALMGEETSRWRFVETESDRLLLKRFETLYKKNRDLQFTKDGEYRIPPHVHVIWLGPRPFPLGSVENIRMWMAEHPDWTFHFWTDRARPPPVNGMAVHTPEDFPLRSLQKHFENSPNWGQKSDVLRYEILESMGGVYIDHDANCLRSFDGLGRGYDFYCCLEVPHSRIDGFSVTSGIGILGAKPHHPVIKQAIAEVIDHWDRAGELYPPTSPKSLREYVMVSTYMAVTRALKTALNQGKKSRYCVPCELFLSSQGASCSLLASRLRHELGGCRKTKASAKGDPHLAARYSKRSALGYSGYGIFPLYFGADILAMEEDMKKILLLAMMIFLSCKKSDANFDTLMGGDLRYVETVEDKDNLQFFRDLYQHNYKRGEWRILYP